MPLLPLRDKYASQGSPVRGIDGIFEAMNPKKRKQKFLFFRYFYIEVV